MGGLFSRRDKLHIDIDDDESYSILRNDTVFTSYAAAKSAADRFNVLHPGDHIKIVKIISDSLAYEGKEFYAIRERSEKGTEVKESTPPSNADVNTAYDWKKKNFKQVLSGIGGRIVGGRRQNSKSKTKTKKRRVHSRRN